MTITHLSTKSAEILLREDGIAEFYALPHKTDEITLEEIKEIDLLIEEFKDTHRLYLVLIRNGQYSGEARKHMAKQEHIADKIALVAESPLQKMVGNFFLGLNRPKIEVKLFNTKAGAEEWLLSE